MPRNLIKSDLALKAQLKSATPSGPNARISDGEGLYLLPYVKGAAHGWRFDYTSPATAKRKTLSLGTYPDTGLALARQKAQDVRELVAQGTDPSSARKDAKAQQQEAAKAQEREEAGLPAADSFQALADGWLTLRREEWSDSHRRQVTAILGNDIYPALGRRRAVELLPPDLLQVLRSIEARRGAYTAHKALGVVSQVFGHGIGEGVIVSNPARDLRGQLKRKPRKHFPAITDPVRFGQLLRAIDDYSALLPQVRYALKLAPLVFLRPGQELKDARWTEFDLEAATWLVPAARMKRRKDGKENGEPHFVPLARQAVALLRELHAITGGGAMLFPGTRRKDDKTISANTLNKALDTMGFSGEEHRMHGFRASARTMLAELLDQPEQVIEAQLAHSVPDTLGRAYNRTKFVNQRRELLQTWADYLDRLRQGAEVRKLPARAA